jgi:acetylornithine aminotransferase
VNQTNDQKTELEAALQSSKLRNDPRVAQAKQLLAEAVTEHSSALEVRSAPESLKDSFAGWIDRLTAVRGAPPIWPYLSSGIGRGPYVELADGSVKLDFIGGIGVHGTGHSDLGMLNASIDAALEDTIMQGNLQQNPASVVMMEKLLALATASESALKHCLLTTSGAMANENALKIAMHAATPADRVIAFRNAFAGRSLAMAAITDRPAYRQGLPLSIAVDYLPFRDPADPEGSQKLAVKELHQLLQRHPGRYAALWAEPIAGEGGYYPGSHEFFAALCQPLRDHGVPIIFDEVQSFSRTTRPFAFQHYELDQFADIVTVGKVTQVCATLYSEKMKPSGPILSQTFTGSTGSIATGIEMLNRLESHQCFGADGSNATNSQHFQAGLAALSERHPDKISGPFGEGMMVVFTPGDGSFEHTKACMMRMFDVGLLGFVCGGSPTRIRFLPPPAITTKEHIDHALALLEQAL